MTPTSSGYCAFSLNANSSRSSFLFSAFNRLTRVCTCVATSSFSANMTFVNTCFICAFLSSLIASISSIRIPVNARSSGHFCNDSFGSETNPLKASNSVTAKAISGLWFASLYMCGFSSCNLSANCLSGCACIERALATDKTFSKNGTSFPNRCWHFFPNASSAFDSTNDFKCSRRSFLITFKPLECVPIHISACGFSFAIGSSLFKEPSCATAL
mmetsp:Transcript_1352/g.4068  ORF Transcript_1352/g.4068 Transcript_1352/m.4068 type:complete len:215 (+) Transcript_1352:538-1182(+)